MIAAIYARKSTEQNGVSDEEKSVGRQIDHARAYAARKGWTVDDRYIYKDDGISGAEFAKRPGFVRLLNAVKKPAPFSILIVSEPSRLGREQFETGYAFKQLSEAGVRVFAYLDDHEVLLDTPVNRFLMSAASFAADVERDKARQRTYDAMSRKARAGYVTGGRTFGYHNEVVGDHKEYRINETEAAVIRRIFDLCAKGVGQVAIAKKLNDEGAPSPRPQQGRPHAWAPSSVREVWYRDLYRGIKVWNRTQKRGAWGKVQPTARPESEWLRVPVPKIRIVSDDQWAKAHARLQQTREAYLRSTDGHQWGRPLDGVGAEVSSHRVGSLWLLWRVPGGAWQPEPRQNLRLLILLAAREVGLLEQPRTVSGRCRRCRDRCPAGCPADPYVHRYCSGQSAHPGATC